MKTTIIKIAGAALLLGTFLAGCASNQEPEAVADPLSADEMKSRGIGTAESPDAGGGGGQAPQASPGTAPEPLDLN